MEIDAIVSPKRQFGYKRGNSWGLNSEREFAKPVFECGGPGCCIISVKFVSSGLPAEADFLS
jgi:hypothetical protein